MGIFSYYNYFKLAFYNTFFSNADVIIPNLWVGSYRAALDEKFIAINKIDIIINCTENIPFLHTLNNNNPELKNIELIRIPVNDSLLEKDFLLMEDHFKVILPYLLQKYTIENKKILIHCREGKQRSAIIAASFIKILLDKQDKSVSQIDHLQCKNEGVLQKNNDNDNEIEQFNSIVKYMLIKRPQVFTYGFRINFRKTYKRYFNIK